MKRSNRHHFLGIFCLFGTLAPLPGQEPSLAGPPSPVRLRLSMGQAVEIALGPDGNARVQIARELIRQAEARAGQARAALLPNIDGSTGQTGQTRNLAAIGLAGQVFPGAAFPKFVGPYQVFDARLTASQSVFDLSAIQRYRASRKAVSLAEAEQESAEDQTRSQVARAYLYALRAEAGVSEARANVDLSEALVRLAENQKAAGVGTGIEVTRARVQLSNQRQRLLAAGNERNRALLLLQRAMGIDLDVEVALTERLALLPTETPTPQRALEAALEYRADWHAQLLRWDTSKLQAGAARAERIPSLALFADYGSSGSSVGNSLPTRSFGFQVRIPLFDGGRRDARAAEIVSMARQEEIRGADLRRQIEYEIRTALDTLASASLQVSAAEDGLVLAQNELAQAERRYRSGVGSSIEVTDAQTRLERARENRVEALYAHNLARIDLGAATGTIRQAIR